MNKERRLDLARRLWKWEPHSTGQRDWMLCEARVKSAACGRRWGKSESTAVDIVLFALENPGSIQIVVAPTEDQTRIILNRVSALLSEVPGIPKLLKETKSPHHEIIIRDRSPTRIIARTAGPNGVSLRGFHADRVVLDEAAFVSDAIVDDVLSPLLADTDGQFVKISTPRGINHFHRDYVRGLDETEARYASFHFPTSANPFVPRAFLKEQERSRPERTWRQEYLAEFIEDAGGVFRGIASAIDRDRHENELPISSACYQLGVDVAVHQDYTVLSVLNDAGRQVYFERFQQVSWERVRARVVDVQRQYAAQVVFDATGVGDPMFESLRRDGMPIFGYKFTSASKQALIDHLSIRLERGDLRLMDIPEQTGELQAYQYEVTNGGRLRMNAPAGMHDDCVIALALAAWEAKRSVLEFF